MHERRLKSLFTKYLLSSNNSENSTPANFVAGKQRSQNAF